MGPRQTLLLLLPGGGVRGEREGGEGGGEGGEGGGGRGMELSKISVSDVRFNTNNTRPWFIHHTCILYTWFICSLTLICSYILCFLHVTCRKHIPCYWSSRVYNCWKAEHDMHDRDKGRKTEERVSRIYDLAVFFKVAATFWLLTWLL